MVIYRIIGKMLYKKTNTMVSVHISMLLLLIENPYTITQTGTLLSFAGTIGLILGLPLLNNKGGKIKNIVRMTLVANVLLIPIIAYSFGTISLTFLISNILASLLIGVIIFYGIFILIISYITYPLAKMLALPLNVLLTIFRKIAEVCGNIPFSQILIAKSNLWEIALYYGFIVTLYFFFRIKKKYNKKRIEKKYIQNKNKVLIVLCILFILPYGLKIFPQDLKVYLVDQRTTNMIPRICRTFERNPLILGNI